MSEQSKLFIIRWNNEMKNAGGKTENDVKGLASACAIYDQMLLDDAIKYGYTWERGYHLERSIFSTYFILHHNKKVIVGGLGTELSIFMRDNRLLE